MKCNLLFYCILYQIPSLSELFQKPLKKSFRPPTFNGIVYEIWTWLTCVQCFFCCWNDTYESKVDYMKWKSTNHDLYHYVCVFNVFFVCSSSLLYSLGAFKGPHISFSPPVFLCLSLSASLFLYHLLRLDLSVCICTHVHEWIEM